MCYNLYNYYNIVMQFLIINRFLKTKNKQFLNETTVSKRCILFNCVYEAIHFWVNSLIELIYLCYNL